jgi:ABC-type transporter Mla MlaB component
VPGLMEGLMLRVTVNKKDSFETWELEGKLSGEWVAELEKFWKEHSPEAGVTVLVHLKAVSYVDGAGKQLLSEMHESGVEIKGCGCMARAVVEDIVRSAVSKASQLSTKRILSVLLLGGLILGAGVSAAARYKALRQHPAESTTTVGTGKIFIFDAK